jgi:hypothetical protein
VVRYCYRPFDMRWVYWEPETDLLDRPRPDYFPHVFEGNVGFVTTGRTRKGVPEPAVAIGVLADLNLMDSGARVTPLSLRRGFEVDALPHAGVFAGVEPNLSSAAAEYLNRLGVAPGELFFHGLATLHAQAYRQENASSLRHDWPHIPLPGDATVLSASAALGRQVAALLDVERPVAGVTDGPGLGAIRPELLCLGVLTPAEGKPLDLDRDLAVTARWGIAGQGGVTMPSVGKSVERAYQPDELESLTAKAKAIGLSAESVVGLMGDRTFDIYLNDQAYWRSVPASVWHYTLGGYQVIKKWLSYREKALLGRALNPAEARYVGEMVRRIAALLLLQSELDESYECIKRAKR